MTPYSLDKVKIGKVYCPPFKPVEFTHDEEFIQDLLLNKKVFISDTVELIACYILAMCVFGLLLWSVK